jgi:hypothetical protein
MAPPVDSATHCERDDSGENCGIDVTPDMVRAGVAAFMRSNPEEEEVEAVVSAVFLEMLEVVRRSIILRRLTPQR